MAPTVFWKYLGHYGILKVKNPLVYFFFFSLFFFFFFLVQALDEVLPFPLSICGLNSRCVILTKMFISSK